MLTNAHTQAAGHLPPWPLCSIISINPSSNTPFPRHSFNEMPPSSSDPAYLTAMSAAVYGAMAAADPGCTWIMQAWLFFSQSAFWQPPQIKVRAAVTAPGQSSNHPLLQPVT
jgi:hypothetical protein